MSNNTNETPFTAAELEAMAVHDGDYHEEVIAVRPVRRPAIPAVEVLQAGLEALNDHIARYQDSMQSDEGDAEVRKLERLSGYLSRLVEYRESKGGR